MVFFKHLFRGSRTNFEKFWFLILYWDMSSFMFRMVGKKSGWKIFLTNWQSAQFYWCIKVHFWIEICLFWNLDFKILLWPPREVLVVFRALRMFQCIPDTKEILKLVLCRDYIHEFLWNKPTMRVFSFIFPLEMDFIWTSTILLCILFCLFLGLCSG